MSYWKPTRSRWRHTWSRYVKVVLRTEVFVFGTASFPGVSLCCTREIRHTSHRKLPKLVASRSSPTKRKGPACEQALVRCGKSNKGEVGKWSRTAKKPLVFARLWRSRLYSYLSSMRSCSQATTAPVDGTYPANNPPVKFSFLCTEDLACLMICVFRA